MYILRRHDKGQKFRLETLDNGLTVAVSSLPQLESVGVVFATRYGDISLPEDNPKAVGAHFLEHMLFRGTSGKTTEEIDRELNKKSTYNATTNPESTVYFIRCHNSDTESSVELVSDMIRNSTLNEEDIKVEAGPILNEYLTAQSYPEFGVVRELYANLFPGHNASTLERMYSQDQINGITKDMLMDIYCGQYTPGNSIFVLYGSVAINNGLKLAQRYFGDMKGSHVDLDLQPVVMNERECSTMVPMAASNGQATIEMALPLPHFRAELSEKEHAAITVMSEILSNTLYGEACKKRGLVYYIESASTFGRSQSYLSISAKSQEGKVGEVISLIKELSLRMAEGNIDAGKVSDATERSRKESLISGEKTLDSAIQMAKRTIENEHPLMNQNRPAIMQSLTLDDVNEAAARYLDLGRLVTVVGLPEGLK